jgi:hypothetical protein
MPKAETQKKPKYEPVLQVRPSSYEEFTGVALLLLPPNPETESVQRAE